MIFAVWFVVIALRVIDIVIQSTGIYLLTCSFNMDNKNKPVDERNIQPLYILNLSIAELTFSILWMFVLPTEFLPSSSYYVKVIQPVILIGIITFAEIAYFATMFCITLDRLVAVKLSAKYWIYWNWERAKHLIISIWIFSIIIFIVIVVINKYTGIEFTSILSIYIYTPLNIVFIILAVLTYTYIFLQYKKSIVLLLQYTNVDQIPNNSCSMFLKSKFKIALMIIVTFIIFQGIPTISYSFYTTFLFHNDCNPFTSVRAILYPLGNILDCCIYIFLQPKIRRLLLEKIQRKWFGAANIPIVTVQVQRKLPTIKFIQEEIMNHNFTITSIQAIHEEILKLNIEDGYLSVAVPVTRMNRNIFSIAEEAV